MTTFFELDNLASSSVWPTNDIPPEFINSLLIGQVTIASKSFEIVLFTDSSNIPIIYCAASCDALPGVILVPIGLSTNHK